MSNVLLPNITNGSLIALVNRYRNDVKGVLFLTPNELENKCSIRLLVLNFRDTWTLNSKKLLEIDTENDILGYKVINATSIKDMQELRIEFLKYKSKKNVIKNYFLKELIYTRYTQNINRLSLSLNYITRLTVADLSQEEFNMFNFYREHIFGQDVLSQSFYETQIAKSKKENSILIYE